MDTELKLEKPEQDTKQGLIIVPGISSGPYGRLFDEVADFAKTQKHIPECELEEIPETGHSYQEKERLVVRETKNYL